MVVTRRGTNTARRAITARRRGGPHYKPTDNCHRHALPDTRRKSETVTTYRRRKS